MRRTIIATALAVAVMLEPAARAAEVPLGMVTESAQTFVLRHGALLRAAPAMELRQGDRLITRAEGSAKIEVADGCTVWVGESTLLVASRDICVRPEAADFELVRAGHTGSSSAFAQQRDHGFWLAGGVYALAFAGTLYAILHDNRHHHGNPPTSP